MLSTGTLPQPNSSYPALCSQDTTYAWSTDNGGYNIRAAWLIWNAWAVVIRMVVWKLLMAMMLTIAVTVMVMVLMLLMLVMIGMELMMMVMMLMVMVVMLQGSVSHGLYP